MIPHKVADPCRCETILSSVLFKGEIFLILTSLPSLQHRFLPMSVNIVFVSKLLALTSVCSLRDDVKLNRAIAAQQLEVLGGKL